MNNYQMISLIGGTFVKFNSQIEEENLKNKYYVAIQVGFGNTFLYLPITDKLLPSSTDSSYVLLLQTCRNTSKDILATGVDGCVLNVDYILSKALRDSLTPSQATQLITYIFPNLMRETGEFNADYYEPLFDTNNKDIANVQFFDAQNTFTEHNISNQEIEYFRTTFINTIFDSNFDSNGIKKIYSNVNEFDVNTPVYKITLNYYKNIILDNDIIYKSLYSILTNIPNQSTSNSTCNICTSTNKTVIENDASTLSCVDTYKLAMKSWIEQMFSNIDFYCQWFFANIDGNNNQVNEALCDKLTELIDVLLNSNYNLSNSFRNSFGNSFGNSSNCPDEFPDNSVACSNTQILLNYKTVLNWIKTNKINANINKIRAYGLQFADLLVNLMF